MLKFRDEAFNDYYSDTKYLSMIRKKFGSETEREILNMLKIKLKRKYA